MLCVFLKQNVVDVPNIIGQHVYLLNRLVVTVSIGLTFHRVIPCQTGSFTRTVGLGMGTLRYITNIKISSIIH